ncbi:MAG TPA: hypothetical protein PLF44_09140, partial [Candidatus Mcinerneyibacteriales bacterium]|nr:hypothetical protein [Candidatus Mcinerneyibacteriales bacterium]
MSIEEKISDFNFKKSGPGESSEAAYAVEGTGRFLFCFPLSVEPEDFTDIQVDHIEGRDHK